MELTDERDLAILDHVEGEGGAVLELVADDGIEVARLLRAPEKAEAQAGPPAIGLPTRENPAARVDARIAAEVARGIAVVLRRHLVERGADEARHRQIDAAVKSEDADLDVEPGI